MRLKTKTIPLFFVFLMSVEASNLQVPEKAGITWMPGVPGIPEMTGVPGPLSLILKVPNLININSILAVRHNKESSKV